MAFNDLQSLLAEKVKPEYIQLFEKKLTSICQGGFTRLFDFFDRLNEPITGISAIGMSEFTQLNKTSVVGKSHVAIQSCCCILTLSGSSLFFSAFVCYCTIGLFVRSMIISFKLMSLEEITTVTIAELTDYCRNLLKDADNSLHFNLPTRNSSAIK